ncbi:hypothetical protein ACVDG3_08865 [Meridianimarinicoccus sp. RP-17]|uniref:hypothetical protein n=1 Tax=Meridianimarinicoccus zhengii TaxID=2056810 RepID=UPI000DABC147|nr:hypothetical protein [Phycocomes zhengii]
MKRLTLTAVACLVATTVHAAPVSVLFVGNSYTFGHHDPALSYYTENVRDLTAPVPGTSFENTTGARPYQPHPWGGVAGIFKHLTDQAGLDYDVALSTRNAASLRGHFLNTNPADWDMRGNLALQTWDKVVLQEQSAEPLTRQTNAAGEELDSNPEYFRFYADKMREFVQSTDPVGPVRDRDAFPGATDDERQAACEAAGIARGTCSRIRGTFANPSGDPDTEVYLYQTWARQNLIDGAFVTDTDPDTGVVTRGSELSTGTFFATLEEMTDDLAASYDAAAGPGFAGVAPVGEAFMRAVQSGIATRSMWADDALTDGLIDLWYDDGTHASKHGSYLSALVLYGTLTGLDPIDFGRDEGAAKALGIDPDSAVLLQRTASAQLAITAPVPLPAAGPLALAGLVLLRLAARRRRQATA